MKRLTQVFGLPFSNLTVEQSLDRCEAIVEERTPRHLLTANVDFLGCCERDPDQRRLILGGDEVLCDGMPLVWASRLFSGRPLPERVAGSDLVPRLLQRCAGRGFSVYFFGSDPETLASLRERLSGMLPNLKIAGAASPPVGPIEDWDNDGFVEAIREARPDVLLVALGFPKQDAWIRKFRDRLSVPLSIGIGASLDFIAGKQRRAPRWMQHSGMEWLWRLATDPRRLAGRYLRDFGALGRAVAKQVTWEIYRRLPVLFPRRADHSALLTGLRLDRVQITASECDGSVRRIGAEMAKAFVCDLSGIETAGPEITDALVNLASRASREQKPLAFFNPSPRLRFWLGRSGLAELFPLLHSPLAAKAFFGEESRALPAPHTSVPRQLEVFASAVREAAASSIFFGHQPIRADLAGLKKVNRSTARWLKDIENSIRSRGASLKVEQVSPDTADLLTIFGAGECLE